MPGPRIPVVVYGPELPIHGQRWPAYKIAASELGLNRTQSQRHEDRELLKEGGELKIKGYRICQLHSPPSPTPKSEMAAIAFPTATVASDFESVIRHLTKPINEQYPRPWMTKLTNPLDAEVFIVGKNQRNGYDCQRLGDHERHLDALFNRNGESCRGMYDEMTAGMSSPTRRNTDRFVNMLEDHGITKVLETNVICYSTPMSADLAKDQHCGGAERGEELFRFLINAIKPRVLIVHGAGSVEKLASILKHDLGRAPRHASDIQIYSIEPYQVIVIPSLAPPAYNKWSKWADDHLLSVAQEVAGILK